jgi:hypothetical protein
MAKNEQSNNEQSNNGQSTLGYVLIGSAVGAGAGLLSSSEKGRKVLKSVGGSQVMKIVGQELTKSVQDMVTEQAVGSVKKQISSYLNKIEDKVPGGQKVTGKIEEELGLDQGESEEESEQESEEESAQAEEHSEDPEEEEEEYTGEEEAAASSEESDEEESDEEESSGYDELKEENESMNERLDRIEKMLSQLAESK